MALIDFDKFLASFITEMKECHQMKTLSIPRCIKKALIDQGLEYKNGEIVKVQRRVSAEAKETGYGESEDEKIRKVLIDDFNRYKEQEECGINTFYGIPTDNILAWLEKQGTYYTKRDVDDAYVEGMAFAKDELEKQKPTWSEEDDKESELVINVLKDLGKYRLANWLITLKQRIGG